MFYVAEVTVRILQMGKTGGGRPSNLSKVTQLVSSRKGVLNPGYLLGSSLQDRESPMEEVAIKPGLKDSARWKTGRPFQAKTGQYAPNYKFNFFLCPQPH